LFPVFNSFNTSFEPSNAFGISLIFNLYIRVTVIVLSTC
jgi:hypothetical protein